MTLNEMYTKQWRSEVGFGEVLECFFIDMQKSGLKQPLENWHFLAIIENNNENLP